MVSVNGIDVTVRKCEHCNRLPSDDEIATSIQNAVTDWRPNCAICDGKFKLFQVEIYHYKESGQDRWAVRSSQHEAVVELHSSRARTICIHVGCAAKVMPKLKWSDYAQS